MKMALRMLAVTIAIVACVCIFPGHRVRDGDTYSDSSMVECVTEDSCELLNGKIAVVSVIALAIGAYGIHRCRKY